MSWFRRLFGRREPPLPAPAVVQSRPQVLVPIEFGINSQTGALVICAADTKVVLAGANREDSVKIATDILAWKPPEQ